MDNKHFGKMICGTLIFLGLASFSQAVFLDDAVSWLYKNGYTIYSNSKDYKPDNYLRRDEAAKFFVKVAEGLGKTDYIKSVNECQFSDLENGHTDLRDIMVKSCRLGILQGSDGKFMPNWALTNSQALVALLRITSGYETETGLRYWAENYYKKAKSLGWLSLLPTLENKEGIGTRGTIAQLVYNYQKTLTNSNPANSNTKVDCGSRTIPNGSNDTAENCMNKQFKACYPATITNLSLDPNQNPFDSGDKTYYKSIFEIIGYKDNTCLVKFTQLSSQVPEWNNKSMMCNFDKSKTFVENINSYYLNKCSGELYDLMF